MFKMFIDAVGPKSLTFLIKMSLRSQNIVRRQHAVFKWPKTVRSTVCTDLDTIDSLDSVGYHDPETPYEASAQNILYRTTEQLIAHFEGKAFYK